MSIFDMVDPSTGLTLAQSQAMLDKANNDAMRNVTMPRLSSTSSGTDITVEPRLLSRPVSELTDDELLAEVTKLRGARGVNVDKQSAPRKAKPVENFGDVEDFGQ